MKNVTRGPTMHMCVAKHIFCGICTWLCFGHGASMWPPLPELLM